MLGRPARSAASRTRCRSPIRTRPGTSYTMLATMVQLMGEDKGFDYLKKLHKNINQYTKSGAAPGQGREPRRNPGRHHVPARRGRMAVAGAPVKIVSPCEGTGYEIGSMSIIKGARNLENAKKWYDWALTPAAQAIGAEGEILSRCRRTRTPAAGAVAEDRRDQADRLRFRQIRLVGRAPAPALEVGQRGQEPAEVSRRGQRRSRGRGDERGRTVVARARLARLRAPALAFRTARARPSGWLAVLCRSGEGRARPRADRRGMVAPAAVASARGRDRGRWSARSARGRGAPG